MVTGKIFETVGLCTPTLLIAPADSDANVVAETTGLVRSFTARNVDGMASFLGDLIDGETPAPKNPAADAWETLVSELDRALRTTLQAA